MLSVFVCVCVWVFFLRVLGNVFHGLVLSLPNATVGVGSLTLFMVEALLFTRAVRRSQRRTRLLATTRWFYSDGDKEAARREGRCIQIVVTTNPAPCSGSLVPLAASS